MCKMDKGFVPAFILLTASLSVTSLIASNRIAHAKSDSPALSTVQEQSARDIVKADAEFCSILPRDELTTLLQGLTVSSFDKAPVATLSVGHLANGIHPLRFCTSERFGNSLSYRALPESSLFYKAVKLPEDGLLEEDDIFNTYANSYTWFGSKAVADDYAESKWGKKQNLVVVKFNVTKPLKLFQLNVKSNIEFLRASINNDISKRVDAVAEINEKIKDAKVRAYALKRNDDYIEDLRFWNDILSVTMGLGVDYQEQIDLLRKYGNVVTNNYSYHPDDEIKKRLHGVAPNNHFFAKADDPSTPYSLVGKHAQWGPGKDQLNRISFVTDMDKVLCDIIATYTNADGYVAPDMPSLWHKGGRLIAEVAVFNARDVVEIVH